MTSQKERAAAFLDLHDADEILVLLNAWDVASARVFESTGAKAVGTTSMGVSATFGFPDVEVLPLEVMLDSIGRIADGLSIPVSADMEAGYGETTEEVVASITRALGCGIVGINIEDGTRQKDAPLLEPSVLAERVAAIREATLALGIHLVINARTDVFLAKVGDAQTRLKQTVARGNLYREAGADCVFVPGGLEKETIRELVRELDAPLNVVANPAISIPVVPAVPELQDLGVARVSVGGGLMRAMLAFIKRAADEILRDGSYGTMVEELDRPGASQAYDAAIGN